MASEPQKNIARWSLNPAAHLSFWKSDPSSSKSQSIVHTLANNAPPKFSAIRQGYEINDRTFKGVTASERIVLVAEKPYLGDALEFIINTEVPFILNFNLIHQFAYDPTVFDSLHDDHKLKMGSIAMVQFNQTLAMLPHEYSRYEARPSDFPVIEHGGGDGLLV